MRIYNMLGGVAAKLQNSNFIPIAMGTEIIMDVSKLPTGIYWLEISSSVKTYRAKFIKQ